MSDNASGFVGTSPLPNARDKFIERLQTDLANVRQDRDAMGQTISLIRSEIKERANIGTDNSMTTSSMVKVVLRALVEATSCSKELSTAYNDVCSKLQTICSEDDAIPGSNWLDHIRARLEQLRDVETEIAPLRQQLMKTGHNPDGRADQIIDRVIDVERSNHHDHLAMIARALGQDWAAAPSEGRRNPNAFACFLVERIRHDWQPKTVAPTELAGRLDEIEKDVMSLTKRMDRISIAAQRRVDDDFEIPF